MRYRRAKIEGGTYFFTVVTYQRGRFLCDDVNIQLLRDAFTKTMKSHPFTIDAMVVLPDHLHCIWTLPPNDSDFSERWRLIKTHVSKHCHDSYKQHPTSESRKDKKETAIWQRRFWEHLIRDDRDLNHHTDYIHYNPVKHKLVDAPKDWPFSSFHRHVKKGNYAPDWGAGMTPTVDTGWLGE